MPPYNIPQTTVSSSRHWKILRCLREHTPFPMLDPHPSPLSARENPSLLRQTSEATFIFKKKPSLPEHSPHGNYTSSPFTCWCAHYYYFFQRNGATLRWNFKGTAQICFHGHFAVKVRLVEAATRLRSRLRPLHLQPGNFSDALPHKLNPQVPDEASMAPLTPVTCQPEQPPAVRQPLRRKSFQAPAPRGA